MHDNRKGRGHRRPSVQTYEDGSARLQGGMVRDAETGRVRKRMPIQKRIERMVRKG